MSKDIDEMERMLNDYLQFAKTQSKESSTSIELTNLLKELSQNLDNKNLDIPFQDNITLKGRPVV